MLASPHLSPAVGLLFVEIRERRGSVRPFRLLFATFFLKVIFASLYRLSGFAFVSLSSFPNLASSFLFQQGTMMPLPPVHFTTKPDALHSMFSQIFLILRQVWKPDLELVSEFEAPGGILSMAASDNMLYTCSTDQSIQSWDLNAMKSAGKVSTFLFQPQKLYVDKATKLLWAGDSQGNVAKFEGGEECGKFELVEEIWDLMVTSAPNLVYTARDRDVVVSELITSNGRPRVMIKGTFQGRSPFCIAGNNFCFMDRDGRNIIVHENNVDQKFPRLKEIVASELIVNALTPATGDIVYSGGYDSTVKKWDLKSSNCLGSVNLGCCVNALSCLSENEVYVAKSDGIVSKVGL